MSPKKPKGMALYIINTEITLLDQWTVLKSEVYTVADPEGVQKDLKRTPSLPPIFKYPMKMK